MKKTFIAVFILCSCTAITAQRLTIHDIVTKTLTKQSRYYTAQPITEQSEVVSCAFGKADLVFPEGRLYPDSVQVTAIDLVFTDYPSADALIALNTERIKNLFAKYPTLLSDTNIEWKLVRQMDGTERTPALNLFHGFVIYYRPLQNAVTIKSDLLKLKELMLPDYSTLRNQHGFVAVDTVETKKRYEVEEYTTIIKLPVTDALKILGIDEREKITYKNYDSLYVYLKPDADSSSTIALHPPIDSTVLKVFGRMQWNNMLVVADVTASMYAYTGQILLWLKLHEDERRIKAFTFFNDGDDKDEDAKIMGNTGGIYNTSSSVFEVVEQLVYKVMGNGNGGGIPENNIEALLKGLSDCNECQHIIMIADNASRVSDMSLLQQLHHPVHIILCGVHDKVNTDYLDIARSTGGSVHTAEQDLQLSVEMKEGTTISIHGNSFVIHNGKFIPQAK
jgi:hypothetical protein